MGTTLKKDLDWNTFARTTPTRIILVTKEAIASGGEWYFATRPTGNSRRSARKTCRRDVGLKMDIARVECESSVQVQVQVQ